MKRETEHKDGYGSVVKYLGMFGGAQGISMLLNLLRNKVVSWLLGTVGLGLLGLYSRTVQMFSDCTNLSLSFSAVRKLSDVYENGESEELLYYVKVTRSVAFLTGVIGMLLFLFLSPFVANFFDEEIGYSRFYLLMLAPVLLFMAVSGGEVAILRGVRRLNSLAIYTLWTSFVAIAVSLPLYFLLGFTGIMPSIFIIAFLQMAGVLFHTLRLYRYRIAPFSWALLRDGADMLKLGAGYIYSTMLVSCSVWIIYKVISETGGDSELGLFSAGYLILAMLPSVLFAALDSEYYPRLSASFGNNKVRDAMVNEQLEVHLLIQVPIILAIIVVLPYLLPLLFSYEFVPAVGMTRLALFGLLFHIMTYPISFMPLSKGDTLVFVIQETVYNTVNVLAVVWGYSHYGLTGAGMAMLIARFVDLLVAYSISHFRYGFELSYSTVKYAVVSGMLAILLVLSLFLFEGLLSWVAGVLVVAISILFSIYSLVKYGKIWDKILRRLKLKK
ncbi:MAG: oligosaccharide flippase family protein [Bacteroidaceae bacterium]|nr:oligosaccharide flippase family protein [Bacteroidaceae bacterium]